MGSVEVLPVDGRPSEPDGFRDFVEARSNALLRSGWLLTGDWPSAEDLVQTALAAAWPRWATLTRQDAPELYVRKIMVNTFLRWRQRRWNGEIATGRLPELRAYGDAFAQIDARQALIAALDRLPPRQRAVVVLRYFADQTEAQTAAAMGCSVGAVKAHASKALARLRDAPGLAELMTGGVAVSGIPPGPKGQGIPEARARWASCSPGTRARIEPARLTIPPQAVTASPAARMFFAAFTSRSCQAPHTGHVQCRGGKAQLGEQVPARRAGLAGRVPPVDYHEGRGRSVRICTQADGGTHPHRCRKSRGPAWGSL